MHKIHRRRSSNAVALIIRASNYRRHHNCPSELLTFYYQEKKEKKCNSHSRKHSSAVITDVVAMFAAKSRWWPCRNGTELEREPPAVYMTQKGYTIYGSPLGTLIMQLCPKKQLESHKPQIQDNPAVSAAWWRSFLHWWIIEWLRCYCARVSVKCYRYSLWMLLW